MHPPNRRSLQLSDPELLELIKEDRDYLGIVYKNTKEYCLRFMRSLITSHRMREEELHDIFQDAVIVLYEKIRDGNFRLTAGFQTYLNAVCRNLLLKRLKQDIEVLDLYTDGGEYLSGRQYDPEVKDEMKELEIVENERFFAIERMLKLMKKTGGNCYELLSGFWYHGKSIRDLTDELSYDNENTTKTQKYKCQKRLQKMVFRELNGERDGDY